MTDIYYHPIMTTDATVVVETTGPTAKDVKRAARKFMADWSPGYRPWVSAVSKRHGHECARFLQVKKKCNCGGYWSVMTRRFVEWKPHNLGV